MQTSQQSVWLLSRNPLNAFELYFCLNSAKLKPSLLYIAVYSTFWDLHWKAGANRNEWGGRYATGIGSDTGRSITEGRHQRTLMQGVVVVGLFPTIQKSTDAETL